MISFNPSPISSGKKWPDAPAPHYKGKAPSKYPNAAFNITGGKGPQVGDKLAAKAARL